MSQAETASNEGSRIDTWVTPSVVGMLALLAYSCGYKFGPAEDSVGRARAILAHHQRQDVFRVVACRNLDASLPDGVESADADDLARLEGYEGYSHQTLEHQVSHCRGVISALEMTEIGDEALSRCSDLLARAGQVYSPYESGMSQLSDEAREVEINARAAQWWNGLRECDPVYDAAKSIVEQVS